tara:strand:+ start:607 stop:1164 length:558 start_codon:yes stop_codon:yes gene_type:complete
MKSVFIGGIPVAGKSSLAKKLERELGILHVDTDLWRKELCKDENLKQWVMFFWNLNEAEYWEKTTCKEQWDNIVEQSEAFWPVFKQKIGDTREPTIFEGVNLLPNLMKETNLQGIYLISDSVEEIFERNKKDPRWGSTEELQRKEADSFVNCEAIMYRKEAEKYGYKVFTDVEKAEKMLTDFVNK